MAFPEPFPVSAVLPLMALGEWTSPGPSLDTPISFIFAGSLVQIILYRPGRNQTVDFRGEDKCLKAFPTPLGRVFSEDIEMQSCEA